jgi:hypothetical protein
MNASLQEPLDWLEEQDGWTRRKVFRMAREGCTLVTSGTVLILLLVQRQVQAISAVDF